MTKQNKTIEPFSSALRFARMAPRILATQKNRKGAVRMDLESELEGSSLKKALLGQISVISDYYFPPELIGGSCPRIVGNEEEIVWNTAAEAADSERIHVVWQAQGDRIWYLAVRSSDMASHASTWCPFAAVLPGMDKSSAPPAIYIYSSDESSTMMTVTKDSLQIHRGTSAVLKAKAARAAEELGGAKIIDLIPDVIDRMDPIPWYSASLFEDRARRILASVSIVGGLALMGVALFVWFVAAMSILSARGDLNSIQESSREKTAQLVKTVQNLRSSPMREQLAKFSEVNDGLLSLNGLLDVYQIKDGKTLWMATIPPNVTADRISEIGGQTLESGPEGTIVGNSRDVLTMGRK